MPRITYICLVVLLIVLVVFSWLLLVDTMESRDYYASRTNELTWKVESLREALKELEEQYRLLKSNYTELEQAYIDLNISYYNLIQEFTRMRLVIENLTRALNYTTYITLEYVSLFYALSRVLNLKEVQATEWYVRAAGTIPTSPWDTYKNLYIWVAYSIRSVKDPHIPLVFCEFVEDQCVLNTIMVENYVQSPSQTLELMQGDCEDMAILLYAMIKYYQLYIHGREYLVWLALIELGDGTNHIAVFIPAGGGKLGILDPAGRYMTMDKYGLFTPREASMELEEYSRNWGSHGGIKNITLIRADVVNTEYYIDAKGSLEDIARYIEETYTEEKEERLFTSYLYT